MFACLDVHYGASAVTAACLTFAAWADKRAEREFVHREETIPAPYEPGQFWRRELPYLLALLADAEEASGTAADVVLVDGYVWLADENPGLGAHLHRALAGRASVVGVAKTLFRGARPVRDVLRGASARPLYVTAVGLTLDDAAAGVLSMHGPHRIPALLARVDRLSREPPPMRSK